MYYAPTLSVVVSRLQQRKDECGDDGPSRSCPLAHPTREDPVSTVSTDLTLQWVLKVGLTVIRSPRETLREILFTLTSCPSLVSSEGPSRFESRRQDLLGPRRSRTVLGGNFTFRLRK